MHFDINPLHAPVVLNDLKLFRSIKLIGVDLKSIILCTIHSHLDGNGHVLWNTSFSSWLIVKARIWSHCRILRWTSVYLLQIKIQYPFSTLPAALVTKMLSRAKIAAIRSTLVKLMIETKSTLCSLIRLKWGVKQDSCLKEFDTTAAKQIILPWLG